MFSFASFCALFFAFASAIAAPAREARAPEFRAPDSFCVVFSTSVPGTFVVNVTRALAPLGADHFYELVASGFYDQAAVFRVVPNFVVQFGINGTPAQNRKEQTPIPDDPVAASNVAGSIVYATAGANTRTTQLFINYVDNSFLDSQGFAPFGYVTRGFDTVQKFFNPTPGSSDGVDQGQYEANGNAWIKAQYPSISFITKVAILP